MSNVVCEHCNESFSKKAILKRHQGLNKRNGKYNIVCPGLDPSLKKKMISDYPHLLKEYNGNEDPTKIIAGTNKKLDWKCSTCEHEWKARGSNRVTGYGCPACVNQVIHSDGRNSLANTHPELAKEYQGDANKIVAGTNAILNWKCSTCEHEWKARGKDRVTGNGCVVCNRGDLHSDGRNSMANTHPELAKEYLGDATKIVAGTGKWLDWKCSTCEHEWITTGSDRVKGCGCPACADHGFDKSKPASVYQIRFHTRNNGVFYKCGITNNEVHSRTITIINNYKETYGDVIDVCINDEIYFEKGSDAWDFERKLKTSGTDLGSEFFSKKFDGYTETFAPSVVPLWNTLKAEYND